MRQKIVTDEEIIQAHSQLSYPRTKKNLAVLLNVSINTILRRVKGLDIQFDRVDPNACTRIELSDILAGKYPQYQTLKLKKRLISEGILVYKCAECGIESWNGKSLTLQLDHIDGNPHNHLLSNLRLLCPNCHSQTDTFCGRNKTE